MKSLLVALFLLSLFQAALTMAVPSTMRAFVAHNYVGTNFDEIKVEVISVPVPRTGEVLIQIRGSSVNPVDWKIIEQPWAGLKFPVTLGFDLAGTVIAIGDGVNRLKVGDEVWADLGSSGLGAYAEYAVASEDVVGLAPINTIMTLAAAATLPLVSLTAYEALVTFGKAPWDAIKNITVLISAGQGGTGISGIQLAKAWGAAKVITAASTPNLPLMTKLGADEVIDYKKQSIWDVVPDNSVDILYENLGAAGTADLGIAKVKEGGIYVYIAGSKPRAKFGVKVYTFLTDASHYLKLDAIKTVADAGHLVAVVQQSFELANTSAAFDQESKSGAIGKLAITIP